MLRASNDDTATAPQNSSGLYYLYNDHLGTPRAVSDEGQQVTWRWISDPFGNGLPEEDPDGDGQRFTLDLRFPGQYYDEETGLHYNYFRYYDPRIGRYITSDPIGLDGGLNTYLYAYANPMKFLDQRGLSGAIFPFYGNWCGPGLTGGNVGTYDAVIGRGVVLVPPIDELDGCCMLHDICYSECRSNNKCETTDQSACFRKCDRKLASCSTISSTDYWTFRRSLIEVMSRTQPDSEKCPCGSP